ncbi:hypothetical protein HGRIS_011203 [Hohenbuehelia grisea]|uniref:Uncharacterized protein n=1 Tax=Hohenbuehelia grisea TaxID=104357 RepID=A0ABR3JUF6_9AGAR
MVYEPILRQRHMQVAHPAKRREQYAIQHGAFSSVDEPAAHIASVLALDVDVSASPSPAPACTWLKMTNTGG